MKRFRQTHIAEQIAQHLLELIQQGRWERQMPGAMSLAKELGANHKSVEQALRLLERQGCLESGGIGRRRKILKNPAPAKAGLRVAFLLWDPSSRALAFVVELHHRLREAGHTVIELDKTLVELKCNVQRVAQLVKATQADAWFVLVGPREVLEWFIREKIPAYAIFGRFPGLPMAATGVDKSEAMIHAMRSLIRHGHKRIVLLIRSQHRGSVPSVTVQIFKSTLEAEGIPVSAYNIPEWEETAPGFQQRLNALFKVTPPTALIIDEVLLYNATCHFLLGRKMSVPGDVSLLCLDEDPHFEWLVPSVAHIRRRHSPMLNQIVRWADKVKRGHLSIKQHTISSHFVPGGTIGPAP